MEQQRNLTLLTDLYQLTMMQGYYNNDTNNHEVVFDLFYRNNPSKNGYAICAGLSQAIEYIENLAFNDADIASEWAVIMAFPFMFAMVMP